MVETDSHRAKWISWPIVRWVMIACFAACAGYAIYQAWRLVWILESVSSDKGIFTEEDAIFQQTELSRQLLERSRIPSLDKLYRLASPETLNLVSGRWQIIEDWDDGLCWYSWGRTQREGRYELRVMDVSDHFLATSIQHPWDADPLILQGKVTALAEDGSTSSRVARYQDLVVFDFYGPQTLMAYHATEDNDGSFYSSIRGLPGIEAQGGASRGIVVPDNDRLYLFSVKGDESGQQLPLPECVPLRPYCLGTHLTVLRRFPEDWAYPPAGVDVVDVRSKYESTTPRYVGDMGSLWDSTDDTTQSIPGHRELFPLDVARTFHSLNEMPPDIRQKYEESLKQFDIP